MCVVGTKFNQCVFSAIIVNDDDSDGIINYYILIVFQLKKVALTVAR